ncbi:GAN protein, partial [Polyodon spathula]|nr:GAN protein [Polyodon spathula]
MQNNGVLVSRKRVVKWLSEQDAYTVHKPARLHFERNRTVVSTIDYQWQADLVDIGQYSEFRRSTGTWHRTKSFLPSDLRHTGCAALRIANCKLFRLQLQQGLFRIRVPSLFPWHTWCGKEDHRWRSCLDGPLADWPEREESVRPRPEREEPVCPLPKKGKPTGPGLKGPAGKEYRLFPSPPPPAEEDYLLVSPPPSGEDYPLLPPPPAGEEYVLVPPLPAGEECLLVLPPTGEGEQRALPLSPLSVEREQPELSLPPPPADDA